MKGMDFTRRSPDDPLLRTISHTLSYCHCEVSCVSGTEKADRSKHTGPGPQVPAAQASGE